MPGRLEARLARLEKAASARQAGCVVLRHGEPIPDDIPPSVLVVTIWSDDTPWRLSKGEG